MKLTILIILAAIHFMPLQVKAHGGKKHKKDSIQVTIDSTSQEQTTSIDTVRQSSNEQSAVDPRKVTATLDDFPSLHPMIVHFAIVLILVAAVLQLLNIFLQKRELAWITAGILLIGFVAVWMASGKFHPHTHGISAHAQAVLDQHDKWADWTKFSAFAALVLQIGNLFVFRSRRWAMGVVALAMAASSFCVVKAGHYGSQLVHIEGIGPQGKFLELNHSH